MKYIDVHCHLDGGYYGELSALFAAMKEAGVEKVISAGFDLASSQFSKDLSERFGGCYFTAGVHPTELAGFSESALKETERLAAHPKCVAIGEIGLDYHYPETDKKRQWEIFEKQLALADGLGLPVVIHSRDCAEDMLELLTKNRALLKHGALMHCYSHSAEMAEQFARLGLYFSFGGSSTWSGSKRAKKAIKALPAQRLLSETDSPYLAPASLYGKFPNTPLSIPEIVRNMAEIRGEDEEQTAQTIWQNAHALFFKLN